MYYFFLIKFLLFFLNSIITCVLYAGTTKVKILDKAEFDLDFVSNFNNAIVFLQRNLRTEYIIKKIKREEKPEVSEEVLRELLINAMTHRNYFSEGKVLIEIFSNRIEISNPGGLLFNKKDLGKTSFARNPLFVDMVHRLHFVERIGSGIERVKQILGNKISFDISEDWFRVSIKRNMPHGTINDQNGTTNDQNGTVNGKNGTVNDTDRQIILEIKKNPHITYYQLEIKIDKSRRTIFRIISKLKKSGIIQRVGSDKTGYWKVIKE